MIALWQALESYDGSIDERAHLSLSIRRRLSSKLRDALRLKHGPLNEALREPEMQREGAGSTPAAGSGSLSDLLAPLTRAQARACLGVAMGYRNTELGPRQTVEKQLRQARRKLAQ